MSRFLAGILLVACLVYVALAANPLTAQDKASYRQTLSGQLSSAHKIADKTERVQEYHNAIASLNKLDALKSELKDETKKQICDNIASTVSSSSSPKTIYETVVVSIALSCSSSDFSSVADSVKQSLSASSTSIQDTYYLARVATLLKKQVPAIAQSVNALTAAFERVFSKYDDNAAAFCADGSKCIKQTGYGYETLSLLYSLVSAADAKEGEKLLTSLVKVSRNTDKAIKRVSSAVPLAEVSPFVRGLNKLASIIPLKKITRDEINQVASTLLAHKQKAASSPVAIYDLVEALSSLSSIFVPVIVSDLTLANDAFQVSISDVFGNAFDKTLVSLSRAYNARTNDALLDGSAVQLSATNGINYSWKPTSASVLEQVKNGGGMFNFEFSIVPVQAKATFPSLTVTRSFISESNASIKSMSLQVTGAERELVVSYPAKLSTKINIEQANDKRLTASVNLVGSPHQVFLRFFNSKSDAVVAMKRQGDGTYRVEIAFDKVASDLFKHTSGEYELQLLVGDVAFKAPISWNLGSVSLGFKEPKRGDKEEEAELYGLRPEIQHRFNPPAKRAPAAISSAFTIAAVAPLALLFIGLLTVGFGLGNCPGGLGFIFGLVFHGLIAAMLGVIFLYWVHFTIFEAMTYLALLGLAAALVGSKQLNDIARKQ